MKLVYKPFGIVLGIVASLVAAGVIGAAAVGLLQLTGTALPTVG